MIATLEDTTKIIPPVSSDSLVCWNLWSPRGLTALTLETACLCQWNKPDLDDIYHILATTCHTLQHFKYLGAISSVDDTDDTELNRNLLDLPELRSFARLNQIE